MKLTESKLKQIIKEQMIVQLLEQKNFEKVEKLLWESRQQQILNEKWWQKLLGKWSPTDKDIKDQEIADKLEDASAAAAEELVKSGRYTKAQAERAVKKYLDADPELDRVDHRDLTRIFFDLGPNAAKEIAAAEKAEDTGVKPPPIPAAGRPSDGTDDAKIISRRPESVGKTTKDLSSILSNSMQRKMLLRGLLGLLTNDAVERVLKFLRPKQAREAVINFLRQVLEMDTEIGAKVIANMSDEIANEFDADANEFRGEKGSEKFKGKVSSLVDGSVLKNENINKELTERMIVLETLNLYFERKLLK